MKNENAFILGVVRALAVASPTMQEAGATIHFKF
jgi:hypothetical protein